MFKVYSILLYFIATLCTPYPLDNVRRKQMVGWKRKTITNHSYNIVILLVSLCKVSFPHFLLLSTLSTSTLFYNYDVCGSKDFDLFFRYFLT